MKRYIFPLVVGVLGCAILISLGVWQLHRLDWKEAMIARIEGGIHAAPVPLPATVGTVVKREDIAGVGMTQVEYANGDALMFGSETRGLPAAVLDALPEDRRLRLPMRPDNRSLNLSNAVAVVVYEAWRQQHFDGCA